MEPGDVDALEAKIRAICEDDETREELGENARRFVENNYSWEAITQRLTDVYEDVA